MHFVKKRHTLLLLITELGIIGIGRLISYSEGSDSMNTNIRRCMISDAHDIYELSRQELGYDFSEEQVVQNVRRLIGSAENLLMVAVDSEDKVIGFIHANNHDPIYAPPMKDIVAIAVSPEFRHHGIGRRLINAVEEWAAENGIPDDVDMEWDISDVTEV